MTYTQEQKELLLDKLFDGVVCLNIYDYIDIRHKSYNKSFYRPKTNIFWLNDIQIWNSFKNKKNDNYQEIRDLTSTILKDLTGQNEIKVGRW